MPLVPFIESHRGLGDFEPRPLSLPMKLGDYFFTSLSAPSAQERSATSSAWMNNRVQHDSAAMNAASLSNILAGQSALLPGMSSNAFLQNSLGNNPLSLQQPQQSHRPTAFANA
ncbi:MAG: hypothetical protein SGARI_002591, partial [Bacillariaceae sp.]